MLLSNAEILRHKDETGAIVIHPFAREALNNVSYDLTLGDEVARYVVGSTPTLRARQTLVQAPSQGFAVARPRASAYGAGFDLAPGERVLGRTREIAGGRQVWDGRRLRHVAVTTKIHATSTAARIGLQVCGCAGFGDVGFTLPWVLELTNMSPLPMFLPVGAVVAQVSFYEVAPLLDGTSYEQIGSYQRTSPDVDPEWTLRTWTLRDGLPKALKVRP